MASRRTGFKKSLRAPFLLTVASAAAALPACGSSVVVGGEPNADCATTVPAEGSACQSQGQTCAYQDECGNAFSATCSADLTWKIDWPGVSCNPPPPDCPSSEPTHGSPCPVNGAVCSYTVDNGCGPQGVDAICENGAWSLNITTCNPPPPDYCTNYATETDCVTDPGCQWLVPGCGMPSLPKAGCFTLSPCTTASQCPIGQSCQTVSVDPCWNKGCNACSQTVGVCLPTQSP